MGTSTAPWAHRVLSPCSYRFNTPSIISPLLIHPGRALLRLQPGIALRVREEWSRIRWSFYRPRGRHCCSRWKMTAIKPAAKFSSNRSSTRWRVRDLSRRTPSFRSSFYYCYRVVSRCRVAATFIHVTMGAMPTVSRERGEKHCR